MPRRSEFFISAYMHRRTTAADNVRETEKCGAVGHNFLVTILKLLQVIILEGEGGC